MALLVKLSRKSLNYVKRTIIIRDTSHFTIPRVNTVYHVTKPASFLTPKIWESKPSDLKGNGLSQALRKQKKINK